jgi:hypothetical protein
MQARLWFLSGAALFATATVSAQDYLDLNQIRGLPASPAVQVDLNPTVLGLASAASRTSNPAAADLLANVEGLRVRVYSSLEDAALVLESINDVSTRLAQEGWQQVVRIQDDGDVRVLMQTSGESVTGVTAMIVHDNEAVFVNLVGSLSPEQFAQFLESSGAGEALASLGQLNFPRAP